MSKTNQSRSKSFYEEELDKLILTHLEDHKKAPQKRGWNKVFGVSIQSKADISRATMATIRELDSICYAMTKEHVWDFEEEDEGLTGNPSK